MSRALLAPFLFAIALSVDTTAQNVPAGFVVDTLVNTGLSTPNDCCFLPDGRCLIANTGGEVSVYAGGPVVTIGIVPNVESLGERGLLSIAADPGFATNGQIYVYYSSTLDAFMHLDRFTCTGALAISTSTNLTFTAASRHVLLGELVDNVSHHNGGSVRFGPDGMLYLTAGDDGNDCDAQSLVSQVGCLLRLDVSTRPPGGSLVLPPFSALDPGNNPLSTSSDFRQLVLAHGLRNPFRMEIDQQTGNLYIGDVGEDTIEEYSEYVYPAGPLPLANFGWPWREGNIVGGVCTGTQPPGLTDPIATVPHTANWAAIMGGARYRNQGGPSDFGSAYEGSAFFLDYFTGDMRRLVNTGTWVPAPVVPGQPDATNWGTGFDSVTSLRQGPDGGLWLTRRNGSGELLRIRWVGPTSLVLAISGDGQAGPASEAFPLPVVVRVTDLLGTPLAGGTVNFAVAGPGTLSTINPVIADGSGYAQTMVTASSLGGPIGITASAPGAFVTATFALFARRIVARAGAQDLKVTIRNTTTAVPPLVPYVVMLSFPGSPILPTPVGPLCIDPFYAFAFVIEDGTGIFNFVSLSGAGGVGSPDLTRSYVLPPGLFAGQIMLFQALGFDLVTGWFRTNCEKLRF